MLQLQHIFKQYRTGDVVQLALNDVSLNFRDSEFVSILGPSGSGKTTLLNIIGGLDRYDAGNLAINGVPTQSYTDRDWDSYRNHAIGFVFQSYNLIPHQTVLANVELALKISGVSSKERRQRAQQALMEVGLGDQMGKRPSQLSGGQMQRVAIARALVNNPSILLADEPTGALDTETSIQVMNLLRNVARNRLVIMVTHNPELAKRYSTRIVQLRDGRIVGDTRPCPDPQNLGQAAGQAQRPPRVGMGFGSALALSLNNLMTKKGRTILTAFAGSIGIIGIALIVAMSSSVNDYVADIQRDTMTSYPITIESQSFDMGSLFASAFASASEEDEQAGDADDTQVDGSVQAGYDDLKEQAQATLAVKKNDLASFKAYLDDPNNPIAEHVGKNGITYAYDIPFDVYATDPNGEIVEVDVVPSTPMSDSLTSMTSSGVTTSAEVSSKVQSFSELQMPAGASEPNEATLDNYEVAYGRWPAAENEVVLVTGKDGKISATLARRMGLITKAQYDEVAKVIGEGGTPEGMSWTYEQLCFAKLSLVGRSDRYADAGNGRFSEVADDEMSVRSLVGEHGTPLAIVGVVVPKEGSEVSLISTPFAYSPAMTDALAAKANSSAPVMAQEANPAVSVLSGMPFGAADDAAKAEAVRSHLLGLGVEEKASMYMMLSYAHPDLFATSQAVPQGQESQGGGDLGQMQGRVEQMGQTEQGQVPEDLMAGMETLFSMPQDEMSMAVALDGWLNGNPDPSLLAPLYDQLMGDETYESTLARLGKVDKSSPSSISIYADTFEDKDAITELIDEYNKGVDDKSKRIAYTDYVSLITGSVTSIINVISYVLIAFVAVSLVVSCIMIGIITHISVLERTKEIGILRALGASRRNVAQVFNAETVIVGFLSGAIGVGVAALLTVPITGLLHAMLDTDSISVTLPPLAALGLVGISIVITAIGGIAPSRKAAWQDPVVALRSE